MHINDNPRISIWGKIKDKKLENEFERQLFTRYKRVAAAGIFGIGLLYTAFLIPEYFTIPVKQDFVGILLIRLISLACFVAFSVTVLATKSVRVYKIFLTIFEFLFPLSYYCVLLQSNQFNFLIKCLDVTIIIAFMCAMPNNWVNSTAAAFFMLISFFVFSSAVFSGLSCDIFFAGATYLILIFLAGCLFNLLIDIFLRRSYINRILLRHLIDTDCLTGIASRSKLNDTLLQYFSASRRAGKPLCLSVFDIDGFKKINDQYGHIIGDKVLTGLSSLISENLQGAEFFARWGGEEFVLIFPNTALEQAVNRVNELRKIMTENTFAGGISLTCSFGVVSAEGFDDTDTLIDRADRLMYNAKSAGKNAVVYNPPNTEIEQ